MEETYAPALSVGRGSDGASLHAVGQHLDVLRRGAAAAAHDRHAVALDELLQRGGQRLRLLREDRLAVRALEREAGVGDAMHRHGRVVAQVADRVAHVLRAGGAVEPDHLNVERAERGEHRGDVGAEQHLAAVRQQRHRDLERQRLARELERLACAEDGGLHLEDVLRRLDDDQVGAALHEALGLLGEHLHQLAERDLAERGVIGGGEEAGGADRAGHEVVLAGGLAGDLGGLEVDLVRVVGQAPLAELDARGLERVRLQHVGAGLDHRLMHLLDHVRAVEDERLVALAGQAHVVLGREVELFERGAHAAVEHDHA